MVTTSEKCEEKREEICEKILSNFSLVDNAVMPKEVQPIIIINKTENTMKKKKLSFGNIKDELSRDELKNIMAGSGGGWTCVACTGSKDQVLGLVCCSGDIGALTCCQAQYSQTVSAGTGIGCSDPC